MNSLPKTVVQHANHSAIGLPSHNVMEMSHATEIVLSNNGGSWVNEDVQSLT